MLHVLHMVIYSIVPYNIIKWYGTHCVRNTLFRNNVNSWIYCCMFG